MNQTQFFVLPIFFYIKIKPKNKFSRLNSWDIPKNQGLRCFLHYKYIDKRKSKLKFFPRIYYYNSYIKTSQTLLRYTIGFPIITKYPRQHCITLSTNTCIYVSMYVYSMCLRTYESGYFVYDAMNTYFLNLTNFINIQICTNIVPH